MPISHIQTTLKEFSFLINTEHMKGGTFAWLIYKNQVYTPNNFPYIWALCLYLLFQEAELNHTFCHNNNSFASPTTL